MRAILLAIAVLSIAALGGCAAEEPRGVRDEARTESVAIWHEYYPIGPVPERMPAREVPEERVEEETEYH